MSIIPIISSHSISNPQPTPHMANWFFNEASKREDVSLGWGSSLLWNFELGVWVQLLSPWEEVPVHENESIMCIFTHWSWKWKQHSPVLTVDFTYAFESRERVNDLFKWLLEGREGKALTPWCQFWEKGRGNKTKNREESKGSRRSHAPFWLLWFFFFF